MSLKEHLAAIKAKSNPPAEVAAIMRRSRNYLAASGLADKAPKKGQHAPQFVLPNIYGDQINSEKILNQGPIILHFYRGGW